MGVLGPMQNNKAEYEYRKDRVFKMRQKRGGEFKLGGCGKQNVRSRHQLQPVARTNPENSTLRVAIGRGPSLTVSTFFLQERVSCLW